MFASQRLQVPLTELGSGVDLTALRFDLTDETASTTTSYFGAQVSLDATMKWAQTVPVSLTQGHLYRVAVVAKDRAGNQTVAAQAPVSQGGGWLAMSVPTPGVTVARIPEVDCVVDPDPTIPNADAKKNATCSGMRVKVDAATVTLSATRHGGSGRITQTVPISSAIVTPTALGAGLLPVSPFAAGAVRSVAQDYFIPERTSTVVSTTTNAGEVVLDPVTVRVPHGTTTASLMMNNVATAVANVACTDSTSSALWCAPDPLPAILGDPSVEVVDLSALPGGRVVGQLSGSRWAIVQHGTALLSEVELVSDDGNTVEYERSNTAVPPEPLSPLREAESHAEEDAGGWRASTSQSALDSIANDPAADLSSIAGGLIDRLGLDALTNPELEASPICIYESDSIPSRTSEDGRAQIYGQDGCWGSDPGDDSPQVSDPRATAPYGARKHRPAESRTPAALQQPRRGEEHHDAQVRRWLCTRVPTSERPKGELHRLLDCDWGSKLLRIRARPSLRGDDRRRESAAEPL